MIRSWKTSARRPSLTLLLGLQVAAGTAAALALLAVRAGAAPATFSLQYEGAHIADSTLPGGLRHDGRFTASAPFCPAGRAYDVRHTQVEPRLTVLRLHTCDDGSGTFTAFMPVVRNEHRGTGTWQIVEGTGSYATLRGRGTYGGTLLSGDPFLFETITHRTNWQGVVGFDADPPAVEAFTAAARRLARPPRTNVVQVGLRMSDGSLPLAYTVLVRAGAAVLHLAEGTTASGRAGLTLRIRPPRAVRGARLLLTVRDALGNETTATRPIRLP